MLLDFFFLNARMGHCTSLKKLGKKKEKKEKRGESLKKA